MLREHFKASQHPHIHGQGSQDLVLPEPPASSGWVLPPRPHSTQAHSPSGGRDEPPILSAQIDRPCLPRRGPEERPTCQEDAWTGFLPGSTCPRFCSLTKQHQAWVAGSTGSAATALGLLWLPRGPPPSGAGTSPSLTPLCGHSWEAMWAPSSRRTV